MKRLPWLIIAIVAAVMVPMLLGGTEIFERLRSFPMSWMAALIAIILGCWVLNTLRLRLLLGDQRGQVTRIQSLGVVMSAEFAWCATPAGSGGPLTIMALLNRYGVRPAQASAVFAMDQLSDLLFFLCALVGVLFYALAHSVSQSQQMMLVVSTALVAGSLIGCIALGLWHRQVMLLTGRLMRRVRLKSSTRWRWTRKWLGFIAAFTNALKLPRSTLIMVFSLTCVHWGLRYSILYLALQGLGVDLQWAWSFLIQILALSAGQFSLLPGGAGTAELTSAALLAPMVGKSTAAAAILIWRGVTYYFYLVVGGPIFLLMLGRPLLNKLMGFKRG